MYGGMKYIMMKANEITAQSFKKSLFGLNKAEVDSFLASVQRDYEALSKENETLKSDKTKVDNEVKELRLKVLDLEKQLKEAEEAADAAQSAGADDFASADFKSSTADRIAEKAKEDAAKAADNASATSKFFQQKEEEGTAVFGDDDEVFVGEIEDNRKPKKAMIGDGEEESDDDFEFL